MGLATEHLAWQGETWREGGDGEEKEGKPEGGKQRGEGR